MAHPGHFTRRHWLLTSAACAAAWPTLSQARAAAQPGGEATRLLAAWQAQGQHHLGLLRASPGDAQVVTSLALPSRPHGLLAEAGGTVLAVARRPGDWLLRWRPGRQPEQLQWHWQEDDRRLNGHVVALDHQHLLTTETDRATGQGWLSLRAAASLRTLQSWPTHGPDPHQLLVLPQAVGPWPAGTVLVANGGITALPETGRSARQAGALDASLVALEPRHGRLLGQWRLQDPWLSIRHLAWNGHSGQVGVALQAEHPSADQRQAAPVLALWDGRSLQAAVAPAALAGYGGDIAALGAAGYAVSCPRAGALAWFSAQGQYRGTSRQTAVCALASQDADLWSGGEAVVGLARAEQAEQADPAPPALTAGPSQAAAWALDNHWQRWPAPRG
jgi:hypothetical protein